MNTLTKINRTRRRSQRRGAAAVEFAIIAPVMLTFTLGLIEISRLTMVKESAVQATREGAREAIRPAATAADVIAQVNQELALMSITNANVVVEPSVLESAPPGSLVTVRVSVPIAAISWAGDYFTFAATDVVAETVMRRESTN